MDRKGFFTAIADHLSVNELQYVQVGYWLVKEAHRKQSRRLTGERYFEHLRRVAFSLADKYGYYDADIITLALIHDVIEDTFVPSSVIVNLLGQNMYKMALTLSKEVPLFHPIHGEMLGRVKILDQEYYAALTEAPLAVRLVKGGDREDNTMDLSTWEPTRRTKYVIETRVNVLPIVITGDIRIAASIEKNLQLVETAQ